MNTNTLYFNSPRVEDCEKLVVMLVQKKNDRYEHLSLFSFNLEIIDVNANGVKDTDNRLFRSNVLGNDISFCSRSRPRIRWYLVTNMQKRFTKKEWVNKYLCKPLPHYYFLCSGNSNKKMAHLLISFVRMPSYHFRKERFDKLY